MYIYIFCYSPVSAIWQPGAVTLPLTAARCTNMADMSAGVLKLGLLLRWGLRFELRARQKLRLGLGGCCCHLLNGTRHQKWQEGRIIKLLTLLAFQAFQMRFDVLSNSKSEYHNHHRTNNLKIILESHLSRKVASISITDKKPNDKTF